MNERQILRQRTAPLGLLQRVLLAVIIFGVPFPSDIHYGYDEYLADLNALGGLQISLTTFCVLGLYALWFAEAAFDRFSTHRCVPRVNRWLILYLAAVIVSALFASRQDLAFYEILILFQTFLIFFFIIKKVQSRNDIVYLASILISSMLLHSLVIIGVFGLGRSIQLGPWHAEIDGPRACGAMGSPNSAGSVLELLLAPCLGILLAPTRRWRRMLAYFAFLAGGLALVVTFSRGSWLAAFVSVSLFFAFAWRRGWLPPRVAATIAVCAVIAAGPFSAAIVDRISSEEAATVEGRYAMMRLAHRIISDNPILGVGANNFAATMGDYIRHPEFTGAWLHTVHNKYLLVWAENGVVGLIAFVGFLMSTVILGWRSWKSDDRLLAPLGLAFAVGILGQMLHMNLDLFHSRPQVQLLWVVCGLVVSIEALACRAPEITSTLRSRAYRGGKPIAAGGNLA